jgi:nicotinate phosphoribosyltransferase
MAAGYFESGKAADRATFELSIRRLPEHRSFVLAAGVEQAIEYLLDLRFTADDIEYLRGLPNFARVSELFWDYLAAFHFMGDMWAVEEGTPLFPDEPVLRISAPLPEAQIPETYLLATISFQSLIATKAARMVAAAQGRPVVEFGTRRAHTPQAGTLGARAAYIGGCAGTSNVETGRLFGIPVYGTTAHSWTLAYDSESEAFARLQDLLGDRAIYLVDTYKVEGGVSNAVSLGRPFWGIRLDSGDFLADSNKARGMLDQAGFPQAKIMASGDLDEYRIGALLESGAPIDSFGVGTELATSRDAPAMGSIYKLVQIESCGHVRATAKFSAEKPSLPGAKQVFRFSDHDVLALAEEPITGAAPLLHPVIQAGRRILPKPDLSDLRERAQQKLAAIPEACRRLREPENYPVVKSERLMALTTEVRELEMGMEKPEASRRD